MTARPAVVLLFLAPFAGAQNAVWVVAPTGTPGADFSNVQDAVNAADSGDTILIRAGTYDPFTIQGSRLSVVADAGANVVIDGFAVVRDLDPSDFVTLSGLTIASGESSFAAVEVLDAAGPVWIDGCQLAGYGLASPFSSGTATAALRAVNALSVVVSHSTLDGGTALVGLPGLQAVDSTVHVFHATCRGAPGQCVFGSVPFCGDSGPGVSVTGGLLTAQSSTFSGGAAAPGLQSCFPFPFCSCVAEGTGGVALQLGSGAPQAVLYDTPLMPGPGSAPCGAAGLSATSIATGTLTEKSGPGFEVSAPPPLREGQPGEIDFAGQPGDLAIALLAIQPADIWLPKFDGPWLVGGNPQVFVVGTVPATGLLPLTFTVPALPPGFESVEFIVQGARQAADAGTLLANPARAFLLDASL